ncbi:MAG: hypothetical protein F6K42_01580 [Leptolyngbya sp. SIO1D8]|nr:hypothetical protein [Leptolyngbya sp. SIO1D8]
MTIPFVIEVAIGLIFIYLTLSLLASEIQEVMGTLLQWRAEHLKRSIEVLLAGNDTESKAAAQAFANRLYDRPLIRSLNQEATGPIGHFFRLINQAIGVVYRTITRTRNVFGEKTSGPSYIPGEAFSQALMESLQLEDLRKVLLESRLIHFIEEKLLLPLNHMVNDLRASTANEFLLSAEFRDLEQFIGQLVNDFRAKRTTLSETIDRLIIRLDEFSARAQEVLPDNHHLTETFMRRLHYLKQALASTTLDKAALLKTLQPTLNELVLILDKNSRIYQELKALVAGNETAKAILKNIESQSLPVALRTSLTSLAEKATSSLKTKASKTVMETLTNVTEEPVTNLKIHMADIESDVQALGQEVEAWFDRGMNRATGVYKRNAKAVAFLVGVAIAISLNADSLHMLDRLSKDPTIRSAVSQAAEQMAVSNPDGTDIEQLEAQVDDVLGNLSIPMGYTEAVIERQATAQESWFIPVIPRRVVGWLITGFAISMGSSFWFGILKRVVDIKSSGKEGKTR